jgi:hypothetical protein
VQFERQIHLEAIPRESRLANFFPNSENIVNREK